MQQKSPKDPPYEELMRKALTLLSRRRYTVLKLKKKLVEYSKEEHPAEIQRVLARLKELRYLDDTEYAKDYISSRVELRPRGKFLIKRELRNRGLHPDLAERVAEETYPEDEIEVAKRALQSKMKHLQKETPQKQREKAIRFLASRGFSIDTIYKAINI
ncbi:regulatory protein RecX [Candidatus Peregrinibacteria bacterium]|jgi:regulatory protein|nr:regulatory protein RecX [Candidatus Peregrinibacteria bacterium]MBT4056480.1 regulatory protein RecX [Candidatus Peregrinibacteria bacterium]